MCHHEQGDQKRRSLKRFVIVSALMQKPKHACKNIANGTE
nr:MAG TPA: hypothetical protein [Caudoviricetes sp.]